jgi:hypothetical protein
MSDPAEELEAFLRRTLEVPDDLSPDAEMDPVFRKLGRQIGMFMIGVLDTGLSLPVALNLAATFLSLVYSKAKEEL